MATASGIPDRQLRLLQLIECPICLNELQDPRLLSCRHIYCYKCLKDYHKKGNHGNTLPCPQCRELTTLYQGGVDNLPKCFFMNELKEVVMAEDGVSEGTPQKRRCVVCSTEDCGQPGVKYCKKCEFLCQQCYDDHNKARVSKSHQVVTAIEGEALTKSKVPPYPPCHRHKYQHMDLYCCTCNIPICTTCSHGNHSGHTCCELDKQADVCKKKLEAICEDTDGLIHLVKEAMDKTTRQVKQAEADIDDACDNVKSAIKIMHDKLDKKEKKMLSHLQAARRRVKKTGDVTADSQMMTLASLQSLKSCQVKLTDKDSPYDYVTVTDSMQRDVDNHYNKEIPGIMWMSQMKGTNKSVELHHQGRVDMAESVVTENVQINKKVTGLGSVETDEQVEVKEVSTIRLHEGEGAVWGIVVHNQRVYVVHYRDLIVYCYTPDGSLSHKYEHNDGEKAHVCGMCLIKNGDSSMLVVSDVTSKSLIWIKITDDVTMDHHHTQQLDYTPLGSYVDKGDLMVCDPKNHKICRYRHDGQILAVIRLPDDVIPWWVTRHSDGDQYVTSDFMNNQAVVIDNKGQVKKRYKSDIQSVKLVKPCDVITDPHRGVLIAEYRQHQVLLLRRTGDVVNILDKHVRYPRIMYLDTDHHRLYVSGTDEYNEYNIFIFTYTLVTGGKKLTMKKTKLDMKVEI